MVPSGRPSPPQCLVSSLPSIVPTVRLTLRTGSSSRTGVPRVRGPSASRISVLSSALSSPWSWLATQCLAASGSSSGTCSTGCRSRPAAFQWLTAAVVSSSSACPTASASDRKPSLARYSRTSAARNSKKFTMNSGRPVNLARNSGFWVATPTGQVSRWQTRISTQPATTSGAVAKPNSSAPSNAATITSRPVFSWPSTCTTIRSRRLFRSSVCCVSARPSSHGAPACLMLVIGDAPVPPSCPEISTTSACAFDTPAATVPTPISATSLTWTLASGLAFFRSWIS